MAATYFTPSAVQYQAGSQHDNLTRSDVVVAANRMLNLPDTDVRVICLEGELWVTRLGDQEDYIVRAGQAFNVRPGDFATAQALSPARVRLVS